MKYLSYQKAHELKDFSLSISETDCPHPQGLDILVKIKAIGLNPVDVKIRQTRDATENKNVVLGWDASGIVEKIGDKVTSFKPGDEVFYSGDITRDGSYSEFQIVDSRIVALKPKTLSFAESAALPLTSITAYEMLFEKFRLNKNFNDYVLIIGAAGGVGSLAIQLLKTKTKAKIIATASREETKNWVKSLGADIVISHDNLVTDLKNHNIDHVPFIFCTGHTDEHFNSITQVISPFGHLGLLDEPKRFDIMALKMKAISIHWEMMFTKSLFNFNPESQGKLLSEIANLADSNSIRTTLQKELHHLTVENIRQGHELLESGKSIGKIVIST